MKTNQRFTLRLLNLPLLLKETRRSLCKWSRRQIGKKRLSRLKEKGWTVPGVTGQENLSPSGLVVCRSPPPPPLSFLLLVLLCQCWLLPATHFTFHQGQGASKKVSLPTAHWPGQLWSAAAGQWASWRTWCDTQRSEHPPCTRGKEGEVETAKQTQKIAVICQNWQKKVRINRLED